MYGGNPFGKRTKRAKSNSYPDFSTPITNDETLNLLTAAKLKLIQYQNHSQRSHSMPPRTQFYTDPGQQYSQPFLIPSSTENTRYSHSAVDQTCYQQQKTERTEEDNHNHTVRKDRRRQRSTSTISTTSTNRDLTRSSSNSVSTVAHDSPLRNAFSAVSAAFSGAFHSSPTSRSNTSNSSDQTMSSFSLNANASNTPGRSVHQHPQHYPQYPPQHQHPHQQQRHHHHHPQPSPLPNRLTVLLCDPTGGRAILRAKIDRGARAKHDAYWELMDMFSLHNTQSGNEVTEHIDAVFLCARAAAEPHGPESLDIAISQLVPFHFQQQQSFSSFSHMAPVFVILVETQPHLIRPPNHHDRTSSLARSVRARDILRVNIPFGDSRVATVASSGTLENHAVLERVAVSLFEFHSPKRTRKKDTPRSSSNSNGLLPRRLG